ncbi:receptor-like protein EIX2 [Punica granatum]|uniref:Receptor-like protein EIX2 n=1 Tax=Punica granatum TaxID=22663 RepID=A0A6P8EDZ8_PUNGR|nr:receptor-like protein EIX2 [Punica granatum]
MFESIFSFKLFLLLLLSGKSLYLQTVTLALSCVDNEREALLKFKRGLTDPGDLLSSWTGRDCCAWEGVRCSNRTGRILGLDLRNRNPSDPDLGFGGPSLGGEISPSLLELKDLRRLDLSMNDFSSTKIPNFLGSFQYMKYLNLSGASFAGNIPLNLGDLSRLRYLDLRNCFLQSDANDLFWLSGLPLLEYLDLGAVDLSKAASDWLQTINLLPSLRELHLSNCRLLKLPHSLPFINFTSISVLDLSNNGFNSSLPPWLFNLTNLVYLDLNSNSIMGGVLDMFSGLAFLQELDLSENSLIEGELPTSVGSLCNMNVLKLSVNNMEGEITDFLDGLSRCSNGSSIENLDLGLNQFSGSLPESIAHLSKLRYLQLPNNLFEGPIPESIGNMSALEEINFSGNKMNRIPTGFGQLSALTAAGLSYNVWEGVISEAHFANLSRLRDLDLYKDSPNISLAFNISPGWAPPFKLHLINIRSCNLGPNFPNWLKKQDELVTVVLNNAQISGEIPNWFLELNLQLDKFDVAYNQLSGSPPTSLVFTSSANVALSSNLYEGPLPLWSPNVTQVYLDNNRFSGPIPPDIGDKMPLLTDLDISQNSLTGRIPLSIGNLSTLTSLVISNNYLTGEIPGFWSNIPFLYEFVMSNNSLSGTIPSSIGSLNSLKFFVLSNNNLSGELPPSLMNCSIWSLDLGENRFSGKIPRWISEGMPNLLILRLRSNLFSGEIPPEICGLSELHILDLSHNDLRGPIPSCVGNLTGLKVELTDIDNQRYEGKLTVVAKGRQLQYQQTLYLVNSFDLSDNRLSGEIPSGLADLVKLGTLNLSMNGLVGEIPSSIGNLDVLETLDLSRNRLSGPIPPGMTSLTKLNHLDLSYNNLSGKIPTANQFQTFNDPSMYEGNSGLCGVPLTKLCPGDGAPSHPPDANSDENDGDNDEDRLDRLWLFLSTGLGFIIGFWGVCGTLIIKKSWRIAYYRFADRIIDKLIVFWSVNTRLRGGAEGG